MERGYKTAFSELVEDNLTLVRSETNRRYLTLVSEILFWTGIVVGAVDKKMEWTAVVTMLTSMALKQREANISIKAEKRLLRLQMDAKNEFFDILLPPEISLDRVAPKSSEQFWEEYNSTDYERSY